MKKINNKKHLSLDICVKETWINNHKQKERTYKNTKDTWKEDLYKLNINQRQQEIFKYSFEGNKKMVKALVETAQNNFNINFKDKDNNNALMYAVKSGSVETVSYLLGIGIDANYVNDLDLSPLILATRKNQYPMVRALLLGNADINLKNSLGNTAITETIYENNQFLFKFLFDNGANIYIKNNKGDSLLHIASETKTGQDILIWLIDKKLDINARNNKGQTPLNYSIIYQYNHLSDILLKKGANINTKDNRGRTPIMCCAKIGDRETLRVLIARGGDFTAKDNDGLTALDYAIKNGNTTCKEVLVKAQKIIESDISDIEKKKQLFEFAKHNKVVNSCVR